MTERETRTIRRWFAAFAQEYDAGDRDLRRNMRLKESHTRRVCREALAIGRALGLPRPDMCMLEAIVLLHDAGRFEQYARYRTFADSRSENHALLTLKILRRRKVLDRLDARTREIIRRAIRYHNRPSIPPIRDARVLLFARLLRDADKLDIWRLVINYYYAPAGRKNHAISIGLPDTPAVSGGVCDDLRAGRIVNSKNMTNLNDFKLLQAGWVFDVNFVPTMAAVRRRRYLEKIRNVLPDTKEINEAYAVIGKRVEEMLGGNIRSAK